MNEGFDIKYLRTKVWKSLGIAMSCDDLGI